MTAGDSGSGTEDLLRELAPQVLGALVRRHGHFDAAEDAMQEALLQAAVEWPHQGVPESPREWLLTAASRRLSEGGAPVEPAAGDEPQLNPDDTLVLLFLCCHPALSPASQIALTLRAVAGLTTAEIARAFLVPEQTMAHRISRAKQMIRESGVRFRMPFESERPERLRAVLHALYLIFNEGYTASSGPQLARSDLTDEAIRLTRTLHELLPDDAEVAGLLALMLLTDARRAARTDPDGELITLADQDRSLWDRQAIAEGAALITDTLRKESVGPYQVQAAIAAVHDEAARDEETDWPQILALYGVLERMTDNPLVQLSRAVATAMVDGPEAGLELVEAVDSDGRLRGSHRVDAVRAHLLEMAGDHDAAVAHYRAAAGRTTSLPERRYLITRAARLAAERE